MSANKRKRFAVPKDVRMNFVLESDMKQILEQAGREQRLNMSDIIRAGIIGALSELGYLAPAKREDQDG